MSGISNIPIIPTEAPRPAENLAVMAAIMIHHMIEMINDGWSDGPNARNDRGKPCNIFDAHAVEWSIDGALRHSEGVFAVSGRQVSAARHAICSEFKIGTVVELNEKARTKGEAILMLTRVREKLREGLE